MRSGRRDDVYLFVQQQAVCFQQNAHWTGLGNGCTYHKLMALPFIWILIRGREPSQMRSGLIVLFGSWLDVATNEASSQCAGKVEPNSSGKGSLEDTTCSTDLTYSWDIDVKLVTGT
jgi:hypothetical protein